MVNISLSKQTQAFRKRRESFIKRVNLPTVFLKDVFKINFLQQRKIFTLPLFLLQSIFDKDNNVFLKVHFFYLYLLSYGVFLAGLKEQMILVRLIVNI